MKKSDAESGGLSSIEQLDADERKREENLECSTPRRPFLRGVNHEDRKAVFFQPRCKLWTCPACAEINKKLWAHRAFFAAEQIQESEGAIHFLTLTSHEQLSAAASIAVWPKAWAKLRHRAARKSAGFNFLLIPEQHRDGRLHIHAIETAGLGKRWWKDNGRACGLGFMADEEIARTPGGAAYYVVKYLTKALAFQEWPKGFRRVRTSQAWPKPPKMPQNEAWEFDVLPKHEQLDRAVYDLRNAGYNVEVLDHARAWDFVKENALDSESD